MMEIGINIEDYLSKEEIKEIAKRADFLCN